MSIRALGWAAAVRACVDGKQLHRLIAEFDLEARDIHMVGLLSLSAASSALSVAEECWPAMSDQIHALTQEISRILRQYDRAYRLQTQTPVDGGRDGRKAEDRSEGKI